MKHQMLGCDKIILAEFVFAQLSRCVQKDGPGCEVMFEDLYIVNNLCFCDF